MIKKILLYSFIVFPLVILFSGCTQPLAKTQLVFGIQAAEKDLWDEAIFRWEKVLQEEPTSAAAHNNLAVAYEKKGLLKEAEKEYEAALKLAPENKYIKSNYQKFKENYPIKKKNNEKKKN
ncbi:MAG: tetratricopeptide repeat protein [Acidobacteriota bacterium]|nr:tetratricopeptide repeat protein [Acidobacteriota bacterium]